MLELLHSFPQALTPMHLMVVSLGVIGGLLLGVIPGLSPTMAVARRYLSHFIWRQPPA